MPEPPRDGSTRVETGARGQGFGLATGGNGQKGIEVETPNFCCPAYLEQVRIAIERGWERGLRPRAWKGFRQGRESWDEF